jgi:hypothetical protein
MKNLTKKMKMVMVMVMKMRKKNVRRLMNKLK